MNAITSVADYIALELERRHVRHVYEMVGGMLVYIVDAIHRRGKIKLVSMHHEQSAAFAACGDAQITGIPGVALATSGPGALNLLTGIGTCYFDSIPGVFITGQVNQEELKGNKSIRQLGFQETDIVSVVAPVTKGAKQINNPNEIPLALNWAFELASAGRPGPVLLDIPMDVQRQPLENPYPFEPSSEASFSRLPENLEAVWEILRTVKRPLVLAGRGVWCAGAEKMLRQFLEFSQIPLVHSLMGADLLEWDHPLRCGLIGTYGNRWANHIIKESDCLLVLGSRLDIRQTGKDVKSFSEGKKIMQVDIEPGELNNRIHSHVTVESNVKPFLAQLLEDQKINQYRISPAWQSLYSDLKMRWPDTEEVVVSGGVHPNRFMKKLGELSESAATFTVDIGQNQMWAAQSLRLRKNQRFLTSGGMGSMGYALPAAVGVSLACAKPVIAISGDGGFQCNIQELEVIARLKLPIKMVVMNNHSLGMVKQFQEEYMDKRYQSTLWGYGAPDFVKIAQAYGIEAMRLESEKDMTVMIEQMWKDEATPCLLEVDVSCDCAALPKLSFGRPLWDMSPPK